MSKLTTYVSSDTSFDEFLNLNIQTLNNTYSTILVSSFVCDQRAHCACHVPLRNPSCLPCPQSLLWRVQRFLLHHDVSLSFYMWYCIIRNVIVVYAQRRHDTKTPRHHETPPWVRIQPGKVSQRPNLSTCKQPVVLEHFILRLFLFPLLQSLPIEISLSFSHKNV